MRIYLDTNVFIAAFERSDASNTLLIQFLSDMGKASEPMFCASELALAELLVIPLRENNSTLINIYETVFSAGNTWLEVLPVDRATLTHAARLRSQRSSLKLPDAIHVAAAIDHGCRYFLSEDSHLLATASMLVQSTAFLRPDEASLTSIIESLSV